MWSISASVSSDRRRPGAARTPSAPSAGEPLELLAQVRRRVGEEPRALRRRGSRSTTASAAVAAPAAGRLAGRAAAVPLREAAAGGGTEDPNAHRAMIETGDALRFPCPRRSPAPRDEGRAHAPPPGRGRGRRPRARRRAACGVRRLDALFEGRLVALGGRRRPGRGRAGRPRAARAAASRSSRPRASTRRTCARPRRGPCARTAAPARSRGRSTTRCRWPRPPGAGDRRGRRPRQLRRGPLEERRAAARASSASSSAAPPTGCAALAARAEVVARWTNVARELVDGPPNVVTPAGLAERAAPRSRASASRSLDAAAAGLPALAAVGGSSAQPPRLIVLRHEPPDAAAQPRLALVGKAVTFDAGGYFLKPQSDIVRQKGDMAGGAAVLAAMGAIAELELPLVVIGRHRRLREHDRPGRHPAVRRHRRPPPASRSR